MFFQTWKKYLPVIVLLMKRSAAVGQTLAMNQTDFQRAAGGRKIKFNFSGLRLEKGKIVLGSKHSVIALDLYRLLQEDPSTRKLIREQDFEFSMTTDFQLTIKNLVPLDLEEKPEAQTN